MNSPKFVGWAAVSSGTQAGDDKASLPDQIYANIMAARRHSGVMLCQFVIFGESRNIIKFDDAVNQVKGCRLLDAFDGKESESLLKAIELHLNDLKQNGEYISVYGALDRMIANNEFDVLTFRNLGRIGRNAALSITTINMCHDAGIVTYATAAPPQSLQDAAGNYQKSLVDAITAVGYENEVHELKERHKSGMRRRIESGRFPGRIPFGYRAERNHNGKVTGYKIVEEQAEVIRLIVRLYLDDQLGTPAICDYLNTRSIAAPGGGTWAKNSVLVILKRAGIYAGTNELNRNSKKRPLIKAPGAWEPIISEADAARIKSEFKARAHIGRSAYHIHRYSRMVYCAECGARCRVQNTMMKRTRADGSKWQKKLTRYQCNEHGGLAEHKITAVIRTRIRQLCEATTDELPPAPNEDRTAPIIASIERVQEQIERTKAGIERADNDYYVTATIDVERHRAIVKSIDQRIERLMAELTTLQDQLQEAERAELTAERVEEIRNDGLAMLTLPDARKANAWLRQHFRVYISGAKITAIETI